MSKTPVALASRWFGVRHLGVPACGSVVAFVFLSFASPGFARDSPNAKNILIIDSYSDPTFEPLHLLGSPLLARPRCPINFYLGHVETWRFGAEGYQKGLVETLEGKYRAQKLDVVIVSACPALQLSARHREELFPNVPIVFTGFDIGRIAGKGTGHLIRVDWRRLRRWDIPASALPPGTLVLYREPTAWERYRRYIVAAISVMVLQSLLIVGLLWQRARKRRAEAVLRESEKRFRVMADSAPSLIWMCDPNGKITYLNDRRLAFSGADPLADYGTTWTRNVHPDDRKKVADETSQALNNREPFSSTYRLRRRDGVYRWMFDVASPRMNGDESFAGFIGSAIDITDQRLAQEALARLSSRLIEVQDKERSRIARELDDGICQRLALVSVELEQIIHSPNGSAPARKQRLEGIQDQCSEIAVDVQTLSHELHSSKLDYLGIVAAIGGLCKELAKQHDVSIEFKGENVPKWLPKVTSLCLFRVAQEALHNALKYSGMRQFAVALIGKGDEVLLTVRDTGAGFDLEEAMRNGGLGLASMQERVSLAHGRFHVESKPGAGTEVVAAVPMAGNGEPCVDVEP
jgi:PAS domain S-box-containing protein